MAGNYDLIRQAIIDLKQVVASYRGYLRELCPHTIGTKNGRKQALFFQFGGESSSGLPPGGEWRCIPVDEMTDVLVRGGEWHTDGRHSQPQTCIDEIDVEVAH
jgi:hypothetical protein